MRNTLKDMTETPTLATPSSAILHAQAATQATAQALQTASIPTEALAAYVPEGRRFGIFPRAATMRPIGEVWRLGTLLLHTDGTLSQLGKATRSLERGRIGYQSLSREERRDIAAAALQGGYPEGTAVNYDAAPLELTDAAFAALDTGSLVGIADGEVRVRWRRGAALSGAPTLQQYLTERAELLIHPPFSVTS